MTREEFNTMYDVLKIRLPSLWSWSEGLPDTKASLNAWYELIFFDLDAEDCSEVTRLIFCGDIDKPYGNELPATYRREARKLRFERRQAEEKTEPNDTRGAWDCVKTGSSGRALRKASEIIKEEMEGGASKECAIVTMEGRRRNEWLRAGGFSDRV
jgi:hypothetical protein